MAVKIEHRVTLPSGVVVIYVQGRYVRVISGGVTFERSTSGGGIYELRGDGSRVRVGSAWMHVGSAEAAAVRDARAALVNDIEGLIA